jgi:membrane protease YdiL (CAAX protease family)
MSAEASRARVHFLLAGTAAPGVASLLLAPLETLIHKDLPPLVLRTALLINPALFVALALVAGARCAPRVGLGAPFLTSLAEGRPNWPLLADRVRFALPAGLIVAPLVALFFHWSAESLSRSAHPELADFSFPLATRVFYGGVVEEILVRWGLMSFLAWAIARLFAHGAPSNSTFWIAIALSALVFSLGHLPFWLKRLPPGTLWLTIFAQFTNIVAGLIFGWLFWRKGLEASIIAHASTHIFGAALAQVLL